MTLSSRAEAAQPEETEALLMELWDVSFPVMPPGGREEYLAEYSVFESLHNIPEAQFSAALMCLPEGCGCTTHQPSQPDPDNPPSSRIWGELATASTATGATPALAMIAAIAKAMEAE